MKNLHEPQIDMFRVDHPFGRGDHTCGCFIITSNRSPAHRLQCLASSGSGWDHVSACVIDAMRRPFRTPTWAEMCQLQRTFFKDDEVVVQYHVPPTKHINNHPFVLHLWRPHDLEIPLPPDWMV